ncbi:PCOLCE2 isoform 7, partial [Pongo abelii]
VPEGKVVVLNFRFIDLESDNLCRYDFVDVYNGHANGQRIGRFCGTFRPGALVSSGNKMMVQMISDANTAGNGFMAMFSAAEPNERGKKKKKKEALSPLLPSLVLICYGISIVEDALTDLPDLLKPPTGQTGITLQESLVCGTL